MPPTCSICIHPKRAAIDADILGRIAIRIIADRHHVTLGTINRHKAHVAHLVAASDARVARVEQRATQQYQGAQAEVSTLLIDRANERQGLAMKLALRAEAALERLEKFQADFEEYAADRGTPGEMVDGMEQLGLDDTFSDRAEAVAKLAASAASTLTAAISALGGGAGKHDELRGKLTGELKTTVTVEGALKVIFEKGKLTPEAQEAVRAEAKTYMLAGIDAALEELPADRREAARDRALDAAKAAWAAKQGGAT